VKPTIYDVAKLANVSVSTVSLALNHPSRVREATRQQVLKAVDMLGFVPKEEAVARARRGVGRIGVIAPFTSFPSFGTRLNGVLRVAASEALEVVVYNQESGAKSRLETLPLTRRVDGLVVMSLPLGDGAARRLTEQRLPAVLIEQGRTGFSSVTIEDEAGGRAAGELLVRKGHTSFGFLGHAQVYDYLSQSQMRQQGFTSALPFPPTVSLVEHTFQAGLAGALKMLSDSDRPTAVFAHSDLLASSVLAAARQLQLAVPEDLAIIGFDDSELAQSLGLTSVRQPLEESGAAAAQLLLAQMAQPTAPKQNLTLDLRVIERQTT
jgi:LacI family transcriptional regulator